MAARKTQATHKTDHSEAAPVGDPQSLPQRDAAAPSLFRKCLLAVAIALEASWLAALVAMALAE